MAKAKGIDNVSKIIFLSAAVLLLIAIWFISDSDDSVGNASRFNRAYNTPKASIWNSPECVIQPGDNTCTTTIFWESENIDHNYIKIYLKETGQEFHCGPSNSPGSMDAPWITENGFTFQLYPVKSCDEHYYGKPLTSSLVYGKKAENKCDVKSIEMIGEGAFPRWSYDGTKITFTKEVDNQFEVFIMDADGSNAQCLTCGKVALIGTRHRGQSSWHPSGEYITFSAETKKYRRKGDGTTTRPGLGRNHDIWIMKSDGTKFNRVTDYGDNWGAIEPHFSHDGKMIHWDEEFMMEEWPNGKIGDCCGEVCCERHPFLENCNPLDYACADAFPSRHPGCYWGPLTFIYRQGEELCTWRIRYADFSVGPRGFATISNIRTLPPPSGFTLIESNGFTPQNEGFTASYADLDQYNGDGRHGDVYIHYKNGMMKQLTQTPEPDEDPVMSPDGKLIAWKYCTEYPCEGPGDDQVYLMDSDGNNIRQLTSFSHQDDKQITEISWKRDGTALALGHVISEEVMGPHIPSDIYILTFKGNCGNSN
ncbi:TolB family protein [Nanoarchaeota archaeon]